MKRLEYLKQLPKTRSFQNEDRHERRKGLDAVPKALRCRQRLTMSTTAVAEKSGVDPWTFNMPDSRSSSHEGT